jgi:hypothetical protein
MITIPLYLAVAQWALLGALGALVIVMFRQLGRLLDGGRPAGHGPATGSQAAPLAYTRPGEDTIRQLRPGGGQPALVAFVDPTCPSCESLVGSLDQARAVGRLDGLRILLLISDPPSYLRISAAFQSTELEIGRPARRSGLDFYQVTATPLLVAIDGAGVVRAAGPVTRIADVGAFAQACQPPASASAVSVTVATGAVTAEGE